MTACNIPEGRRVLFIAPSFHGYGDLIHKELKKSGCIVTSVIFNGTSRKFFKGRRFEGRYWESLKEQIMDNISKESYDIILVINLRVIDMEILSFFKKRNPGSETIIYLWDSVFSHKQTKLEKLLLGFDYCYSFDYNDCIKFPEYKLIHRPNFFHPYIQDLKFNRRPNYAISSVMSAQPHRIVFLNNLLRKVKYIKMNIYVYISSYFTFPVYLFNHSVLIKTSYINRKKLTILQTLELFNDSNGILDISPKNQGGLTFRSLDALGMDKKLITTNQQVFKYDFYNSNNILVIPPGRIEDIPDFLQAPFIKIPEEIRAKYNLEFWVKAIINHEEVKYTK